MKKVLIVLLAVITVFALFSCASSPKGSAEKGRTEQSEEQAVPSDIPDWYLNPPSADDAFYGVGSAKMSKLDTSRKMAIARAREDIAFQMKAKVKAAITDYAQEAGVDGNNQVISFVETVSKQITDATLMGAKTEEVAAGADGTVYALVSYPMNNFMESAASEFERNEDAAFAEFKAQQALERLNAELENNPPQAGQSENQ
jgi:hypothetical protein